MRFELKIEEDRRKAFREIRRLILSDLMRGRMPTFHVLHFERDGLVDNHYMTPISLEPADEQGNSVVWFQDFEFFLKLLLSLRKVVEVEYDHERPAVIFTYSEV